ncbi:cupin domain-containing protein [Nocardioides agariphilus]|jgi:mannose-6-phosphate isomerase-like protein (cupin superfamily)|uniref:Cupin domain-containing protein n=1 Tax=Nocardioides agariphilus TaxID=433664 RepID=A0A930YI76_9ACTN|nr:cupin domain-containing protein [Nocardioides agariphilus]MBF4767803.1 cupin domain-containing protein [Nocardioides agariphilus]
MDTQHTAFIKRSYDEPDERRTPPHAVVDVVRLGSHSSARLTLQPGWRWSESVKPIVGTEHCQVLHVGVVHEGRLGVSHGTDTFELAKGDVYVIEPGHDAWVIGDEAFVGFEFESNAAEHYATVS